MLHPSSVREGGGNHEEWCIAFGHRLVGGLAQGGKDKVTSNSAAVRAQPKADHR